MRGETEKIRNAHASSAPYSRAFGGLPQLKKTQKKTCKRGA